LSMLIAGLQIGWPISDELPRRPLLLQFSFDF
jgi:hypothetical protein